MESVKPTPLCTHFKRLSYNGKVDGYIFLAISSKTEVNDVTIFFFGGGGVDCLKVAKKSLEKS